MFARLTLMLLAGISISGCLNTMQFDVAPPQCTVDEKTSDCSSVPTNPSLMTEEPFFRRK